MDHGDHDRSTSNLAAARPLAIVMIAQLALWGAALYVWIA